ncbi:hypothetical protein ETAA8_61230 [Anatilimnocola aggregata]|uniref:VWFA domain-containing protein n=1 Tax=Anatilimnocola aggregata TaxID=2528021 RepID=A0A517YL94_9BACT|nr:hypothetical protein [Anatilimnocola aggregata]QDU30970.1 hypothetical protein ETAA8_61230 [Anatilimnocola aggregata]
MNPFLLAADSPPAAESWWQSLLKLLGHDFKDVAPGEKIEFQWTNMPTSAGVFLLIAVICALVYAVFFLYRRELDTCPRWVKTILAVLRTGVVLLLTIIFLGPSLVVVKQRTIKPALVVARDASQSMITADRYADEDSAKTTAAGVGLTVEELRAQRLTRAQIVDRLLDPQSESQLLAELAKRGRVQTMDFADRVEKLDIRGSTATVAEKSKKPDEKPATGATGKESEIAAVPALPPLKAEGRGTDLWTVIREAAASDNPAAAVIFSDGQHTAKDDPHVAAAEAKERGMPLFIVGVGDPSKPRNLRVTNVYVRPQVWQDEPFEIDAMIVAQGLDASEVRVELIEQRVSDSDQAVGDGTVVQSLQLPVPDGGGRLRAQFSHTAKEAGRATYKVKVEPLDDELDEADNQQSSSVVKILSRERVRVLLIAGAPTWEFRLVQKLLARDKTIVVSCWLQTLDEERAQEGTRPISRLPVTREDLFWYDVIMMFDPNPQEFDQPWIELLKQFVGEHSGGLLFMAGPKYSGRFLTSARTSEFQKVLPVSFGDVGAMEVASLLTTNQRAWPLKVVQANADHPTMRFYPDRQETLQRWETLPGIFWSFPSQGPKPTAQVLLEHSDPTLRSVEGSRPLIVAGRYGSGHTLYLGMNGTWRWRRAGRQAEFFDKFWIQSVRYLVEGRSLEGRRRGYVQTDRDRYEVGEKIQITARLQDSTYNPLDLPRIDATLQIGSDTPETVPLLPIANQKGAYQATLTARKTGINTVRINLPSGEAEGSLIETPFTIELPSVETSQVWLDKPLLKDLAELSGGKYFDVSQLKELAAAIPDKSETIEVRDKPDPLWDVRGMLIGLVALLGVEWFVRKQYKLM